MWFQTHVRDSGQFNLSSKDKVLARQERLPKTAPDSECFHFPSFDTKLILKYFLSYY